MARCKPSFSSTRNTIVVVAMTHHRIAASLDHKFGAGALHVTQVGRVEGEVPRLQVVRIKAIQRRREALASEGEVVHLATLKIPISMKLTLIG